MRHTGCSRSRFPSSERRAGMDRPARPRTAGRNNYSIRSGFSPAQGGLYEYGYALNLAEVARIWRGGCIIRSDMLEPFGKPSLRNLISRTCCSTLSFLRK